MSFQVEGSFNEFADYIKNLKSKIQKELPNIKEEFLEGATRAAQLGYDEAIYSGEKDDIIYHSEDEVIMAGTTALFIEFGTGVYNPEHTLGMYQHGTYGRGFGANEHGWIYVGSPGNSPNAMVLGQSKNGEKVRTKGEAAQEVMYKPYLELLENGTQKIMEVLNK